MPGYLGVPLAQLLLAKGETARSMRWSRPCGEQYLHGLDAIGHGEPLRMNDKWYL